MINKSERIKTVHALLNLANNFYGQNGFKIIYGHYSHPAKRFIPITEDDRIDKFREEILIKSRDIPVESYCEFAYECNCGPFCIIQSIDGDNIAAMVEDISRAMSKFKYMGK